jgi:hypothetical protein
MMSRRTAAVGGTETRRKGSGVVTGAGAAAGIAKGASLEGITTGASRGTNGTKEVGTTGDLEDMTGIETGEEMMAVESAGSGMTAERDIARAHGRLVGAVEVLPLGGDSVNLSCQSGIDTEANDTQVYSKSESTVWKATLNVLCTSCIITLACQATTFSKKFGLSASFYTIVDFYTLHLY